jgi:regulator of protease activity HflC (stomatin/prohibitin superfamily)
VIDRLHVRKHQKGLRFVRGDFRALLQPGSYVRFPVLDALRGVRTQVVDVLEGDFAHALLPILVKEPAIADALHVLDLGDTQRALVWKDGRLDSIRGPGLHAFWKEPASYRFEVFDTGGGGVLVHERLDVVLGHRDAARFLRTVDAKPGHEHLVFRGATLVARVTEGRHVLWADSRPLTVRDVDLREQTADVAGQEIMTRDKVTLRVNLVLTWQVTDAVAAVTVASDLDKALYREAQLVLRASVGGRTLDALLSDKETVGREIEDEIGRRAKSYGTVVRSVGIRDVVLPGEMKTILNQVILAEKEAEANLIKRREETAAARSQANTARLLAENPVLARMKELEALQAILSGAKATFVLGPEGLAPQIRTLLADE